MAHYDAVGVDSMVNRDNFESIVDYTTVLNGFEGPIDLLLYLINKNEIEIEDVFVSQVTEQFLDYMKGLPYLDVDKVSDYLNIAATILKIKAQSLVPNLDDDPEIDMEIEEDKAGLIEAIEEFKLIREESVKLKERETIGYFFKQPDKGVGDVKTKFLLDGLTLDGLVAAFSKLMMRHESERFKTETREIPRDTFTVTQKVHYILESLETAKEVEFTALFRKNSTKSEVVTTFQALLELLKHQYLHVSQNGEFGDIILTRNPDRSEEEDTLGQLDEYD